MPSWRINPALDLPPSRQLVEAVLDAAASDRLEAGEQLPSVRNMAAQALVNHNTVARAWRELEHLGVIAGENGRGVFVTSAGPRLARELRCEQTLACFEQAVREALRAGHAFEELVTRMSPHRRESA